MAVGTEFIIDQLKYIVLTESGTTGTVSVGAKDTNITGDIVIPETVSNGGITYTVDTITSTAFLNCVNVTSIYISKTITNTSFNFQAFNGTNMKLRSINVDPDNSYLSSLDGVLYSKDKNILYKYPQSKLDISYKLPNSVNNIHVYALNRTKLKYI